MQDVVIGSLGADMASPDDAGARRLERRDESGRLRVVQDHDIAGAHARHQLGRIACHGRPIGLLFGGTERLPIAGIAVQEVVQPFGDAEEALIAADDEPTRVDAGTPGIGDQRAEHFRDAAADRGGIDVPHDPSSQEIAATGDAVVERLDVLAIEQGTDRSDRQRRDLDLRPLGEYLDSEETTDGTGGTKWREHGLRPPAQSPCAIRQPV